MTVGVGLGPVGDWRKPWNAVPIATNGSMSLNQLCKRTSLAQIKIPVGHECNKRFTSAWNSNCPESLLNSLGTSF